MDPIEQHELVFAELESMRRRFREAVGSWPVDVSALADCIIERGFEQGFDINAALEICGITGSSIYARFRFDTGRTPRRYVEDYRIEGSQLLLAHRHLNVGQIAFYVGYRDCATFCRAFKRRVGHTPLEYREYAERLGQILGDGSAVTQAVSLHFNAH